MLHVLKSQVWMMSQDRNQLRPIGFSKQETVFENQYMRLYKVKADFGDFSKEYFVSDKKPKIGIMVWHGGRVLLVRQYRFIINTMSWELPGGSPLFDESHEQTAARECMEESGVVCENIAPFFRFEHSVETTRAAGHIYSATTESVPGSPPQNRETDALRWVAPCEFLQLIHSGEVREPMTMIALLKYCAENPV